MERTEKYKKEKERFFSSDRIRQFGILNLQRNFNVYWQRLVKEEEKKGTKERPVKRPRESSEQDLEGPYQKQVAEIKQQLYEKYQGFKKIPESHADYDTIRLNYAGKEKQWTRFWKNKMDRYYEDELFKQKAAVWTKLRDENDSSKKKEEEEGIDEVTRHSSAVEKLLEMYDIKVTELSLEIRQKFSGFRRDSSDYPFISYEKERFLKRSSNSDGKIDIETVIAFEEGFASYWNKRVKELCEQEIEVEKSRLRRNWMGLISVPGGATIKLENEGAKRRKRSDEL